MPWIFLLIAGLLEIVWATALKYTDGFTRWAPSTITIAGMILSFIFLSMAMKTLPLGTAYAVWTGIGAVGTVIAGLVLFHEPQTVLRFIFISLIIGGIIGLKATSPH